MSVVATMNNELNYVSADLFKAVKKRVWDRIGVKEYTIAAINELVNGRDESVKLHIGSTSHILKSLIKGMRKRKIYTEELNVPDIDLLVESSRFHDLGKISIHDKIMLKPGKLTPKEFELMKKHVEYGVMLINKLQKKIPGSKFWSYAKIMIETHHEKWNGTGYPNGLAGEDIPLFGRLMAITDVYDALISDRPYKNAMSADEALHIIKKSSETHFDPVIAEVFPEIILNDGIN